MNTGDLRPGNRGGTPTVCSSRKRLLHLAMSHAVSEVNHQPNANHATTTIFVNTGSVQIKYSALTIPKIGTSGTIGVLNGRCRSGLRRRRIHTPAHTMANASSVPIFTSSLSLPIGSNAGINATIAPTTMFEIHGVRNFG